MNTVHKYDDILRLPHHVSSERTPMPRANRAAQFAPFAALTGHEAAIRETARLTCRHIELDEGEKAVLDRKLRQLRDRLADHPTVTVTYFQPDERKVGGAYITVAGSLEAIDEIKRAIRLSNELVIPIEAIYAIGDEEQPPFD